MSRKHLVQYTSPNIVIVPTVSFCPPCRTTDTTNSLNSGRSGQSNVNEVGSLSGSHNNQHVTVMNNIVVNTNSEIEAEHNYLSKQETILTEDLSTNMSYDTRQLPLSKYKSRNNLVDLTGFNLNKRDNMNSSVKLKDSKPNYKAKIVQDVIKTTDVKENKKNSHSNTCVKDNKNKIETKKSSVKETNSECKTNANRSKQNTDMEEKMKKYFKHLWRHSFEKMKDKSNKKKRENDLKSSRPKEQSKEDKLKRDSKCMPGKNTSKSKIDSNKSKDITKEYNNLKKLFLAEYRSKSDTKSSFVSELNKEREENLSAIAVKRCKDFQRFLQHEKNDNKARNSKKTETVTNKSKLKHVNKNEQIVKTDLHANVNTNLDKKETVKPLKSVVQLTKKIQHSQHKHTHVKDLRSKLTRKRTRSESNTDSTEIFKDQLGRENLIITVKQDVKPDPTISTKLSPNKQVIKPITKKSKKIRLVINIEYQNSADSEMSDESSDVKDLCTSPQDLSFLDNFDVDEIVNSLNYCEHSVENKDINKTENTTDINKTSINKNMVHNVIDTITKEIQINNINVVPENIKKTETAKYVVSEDQVIIIDSDDEDFGSIESRSLLSSSCYKKIDVNSNIAKEKNVNALQNDDTIVKTLETMFADIKEQAKDVEVKKYSHIEKQTEIQPSDNLIESSYDTISTNIEQNAELYKLDVEPLDRVSKDIKTEPNIYSENSDNNVEFLLLKNKNNTKTGQLINKAEGKSESDTPDNKTNTTSTLLESNKEQKDDKKRLNYSQMNIQPSNVYNKIIKTESIDKITLETCCAERDNKKEATYSQQSATENSIDTTFNNSKQKFNIKVDNQLENILDKNIDESVKLDNKYEFTDKSEKSTETVITQQKTNVITRDIATSTYNKKVEENNIMSSTQFVTTADKLLETVKTMTNIVADSDNQTIIETKLNSKVIPLAPKAVSHNIRLARWMQSRDLIKMQTKSNINTKQKHANSEESSVSNETTNDFNTQKDETKSRWNKMVEDKLSPNLNQTKTDINTKQKHANSENPPVSNEITNDFNTQKDETKSKWNKMVEDKLSPHFKPFAEILEKQMFNYLKARYTVLSQIQNGRFSTIYKCKDVNGELYAVKLLHMPSPCYDYKAKDMYSDNIIMDIQRKTSKENSCLLFILNTFTVNGNSCFLTEYYPKNLQQALEENGSFHIDLVKVLSKQLVSAVTALTNNNIIHSEIKPTQILLNSTNDRLKLSGLEKCNYSNRMIILPCTGQPSYRAPEMILGFQADFRIDVWSTALIMFEMATDMKLFPGTFNNDILCKHLCTIGDIDMEMVRKSKFKRLYFRGTSFIRRQGNKGKRSFLIHSFKSNQRIRKQIFGSYQRSWRNGMTKQQNTEYLDELEKLCTLLIQMLVLDPRLRLPIQFVGASDFLHF